MELRVKVCDDGAMQKSFTLRDLPKEERPRERLVKFGEQALSAQELLQVILGRGVAGESVSVTAQKLLTQFGSLQKLSEAGIDEMTSIKGIGLAKATQIKAVFEIGRRLSTQTPPYKNKELTDPEKVCQLVKSKLKNYHKEHFYSIALNSRNHSIAEVSVGSLGASIAHPRGGFAETLKKKSGLSHFRPQPPVRRHRAVRGGLRDNQTARGSGKNYGNRSAGPYYCGGK